MQRRQFITLLGGTAAGWPLAVRAQQSERMRRIGILMPYPPRDVAFQERVRAFREELRKRGWASGVNVHSSTSVGWATIWSSFVLLPLTLWSLNLT